MIVKSSSHRLYPADLLEKAISTYYPNIDFDLYCEPFFEEGKPHWAFDNYRLNGFKVGTPLFYTQPGWGKFLDDNRTNFKCVTYACDPEIHRPLDLEKEFNVGFIGELRDDTSEREKILEEIGKNFDCYLSNDVLTQDISAAYSKCKVIFNHIRTEEINIRFFEGLAIGAQVVSHSPALHYFAKEGKHYLSFKSVEEAIDKINYLLKHDNIREKMAKEARQHALEFHTYKHRAEEMLSFIGGKI
jgi:glycosyltransferase involved in cell wall biosynthesis